MHVSDFSNGTVIDKVDWIDSNTKSFYNVLRTPSRPLFAKGLLYSTNNASYGKIKIQICDLNTDPTKC
jgi:hypothetical protein